MAGTRKRDCPVWAGTLMFVGGGTSKDRSEEDRKRYTYKCLERRAYWSRLGTVMSLIGLYTKLSSRDSEADWLCLGLPLRCGRYWSRWEFLMDPVICKNLFPWSANPLLTGPLLHIPAHVMAMGFVVGFGG